MLTYFFLYLAGVCILGWSFFIGLRRSGTGGTHFMSSESLKLYVSTGVMKHC